MLNIVPRDYQNTIVETAKHSNTLVVLPTGIGKTLIALMLAVERIKAFPTSKILMLAPTRPLVEQHLETFTKHLPDLFADLQLFTGSVPPSQRKKIWQTADIIFSTPQCIANDLDMSLYSLNEVSLIIFDEAHRCLKNYDYTKVVNKYKSQASNPRILGLTASPGSDYDIVNQICKHLDIQEVEIRSRESNDVKPYIHELEFTKVEVPFPPEFIEMKVLLKRLYDDRVNQLKSRNLMFGPTNKITLLKLQANLARQASQGHGQAMYGMSLTAQAIKIAHALELLETQTLSGLRTYLQGLMKQAEEKKSKGVQTLVKSPEFNAAFLSLTHLLAKKTEHPKLEKVLELVSQELQNEKAKVLVFTQFRETALRVLDTLKETLNVRASIFIGQAKKASGGMSQKEQKSVIEKFKEGTINTLIATSIGEEGLDIPEVNAVIFYEPIPSAIRKIQRAGRTARHAPGKLFILVTKDTRDEIHHYAAAAREKKMYKTIEAVKRDLKSQPKPENKTLKDFT